MADWNSSPHTISDVRDWADAGRLELRPDYQRREVWSRHAQVMLMDTILKKIPMPKIFLSSNIKDGSTYRAVIDGQQRINAILSFLRDDFPLNDSFEPDLANKYFSELSEDTQKAFLIYSIDFNEAVNASDEESREVYSRVNKYTVALTKQELRKADFPGDFLAMAENLSLHPFLDEARIFTPLSRKRYGDAEFVSELLAAMIGKVQDKKSSLEDYYRLYAEWDPKQSKRISDSFEEISEQMNQIFGDPIAMSRTRFRQKADFYSLFLAIYEHLQNEHSLPQKSLEPLQQDLMVLTKFIRPESEVEVLKDYAIKCVSQANSASSRRWRKSFMVAILNGSYCPHEFSNEQVDLYYKIKEPLERITHGIHVCKICGESDQKEALHLAWQSDADVTQFSNSVWLHRDCADKKWVVIERPADDQPSLFDGDT